MTEYETVVRPHYTLAVYICGFDKEKKQKETVQTFCLYSRFLKRVQHIFSSCFPPAFYLTIYRWNVTTFSLLRTVYISGVLLLGCRCCLSIGPNVVECKRGGGRWPSLVSLHESRSLRRSRCSTLTVLQNRTLSPLAFIFTLNKLLFFCFCFCLVFPVCHFLCR